MKQRIKQLLILTAIMIGLGSSAMAQGTLTWDWNFHDPDNGYSGGGTFITTDVTSTENNGFVGYLITGITGNFAGYLITGLLAPGSFKDIYLNNPNDNLLSASNPQLSDSGVAFRTASASGGYTLFYNTNYGYGDGDIHTNYLEAGNLITFTATIESTPEPSALTLAVLGVLGGFYIIRRRK